MLRLARFWTENYRCFGGRFELDLSLVRDYRFSQECVESGTVMKGVVLGPNGSGKTSLGLAVTDIRDMVRGRREQPSRPDQSKYESVFHYEFTDGDSRIEYEYARTGRRTLSRESLSISDGETVSRNGLSDSSFLLDNGWKGQYPDLDRAADAVRDFASKVVFVDLTDPSAPFRTDSVIADRQMTGEFREYMERSTGRDYSWIEEGSTMLRFSEVASAGEQALEELFALSAVYEDASLIFVDGLCDGMGYNAARASMSKIVSEVKCQLIGTTFNTGIVSNDVLRPDCVFMMGPKGAVPLCDLTDKEIRLGNSLEKMLRNGEFGDW